MTNGVPNLGPVRAKGVEVTTLAQALTDGPRRLEPWLGRVVPPAQGFVAQNTALFGDGVVVAAAPQSRGGVLHIRYEAGDSATPTLSLPRLLVLLDAGSELTLVEHYAPGPASGKRLESSVTEIVLAEGAQLEHVRIVDGHQASSVISSVGVVQARASRYTSRVFTFGGTLSRLDLGIRLDGHDAECTLEGLYFAGQGERVDHHTRVEHAVPRTTSREEYKGILDGDGLSVFDGTVVVRRGASRTVAHQENRNLLLSNEATAHAKPHLEIDTDDVKCSHGATVGRLDPAQLFYLRSRGIDADVARALLTFAFGRELIGRVGDVAVRERLERSFAALLPGGVAAREVV
jgi:Fe-S cluster assembly protein SufD